MITIHDDGTPDDALCRLAFEVEALADRHAGAPGMAQEAAGLKALAHGLIQSAERLNDTREGGPTAHKVAA